jgi:hypothetical protein
MDLRNNGQTHSYLWLHGSVAEGLIQRQKDGASKLHRLACLAKTGDMKMTPKASNMFRIALQHKVSASLQHLPAGLTS